ncbi:MAG: branched-chain alpha-keto acid dehydrogenase subunit E2 [Novosphingobium sp. 17-62-19]|uniref:dihydrolipoamide acetyltransferase family protein n=1 Tax=Novosphingobium sp. 17-62-19 TaxID=1970406 RepID=UPI000BC549D9|nr:dihydrolipoamide acetyltransferase family protein [Novosphingobium sp. 17-62-19]OZA17692.1 MAG: branched-chain alpha-keto acid dehydrogenase subunit E2 [Novosphingobium sp. 17-62-19]HQS95115.1 dihydrolipoamide acetyltransferase family protein [Novosphingobium sp.]
MGTYTFRLPDIGEGIAEAEIVAWHVAVGDMVEEDGRLADMMTDKATVEMESPVTGKVVSIAGEVGDVVAIGSALVVIETEGEGESAAPTSAPAPKADMVEERIEAETPDAADVAKIEAAVPPPAAEPISVPAKVAKVAVGHEASVKVLASPAVRQRARNLGIDLAEVRPSEEGRIRHADLDQFLAYNAQGGYRSAGRERGDEVIKVIGMRRRIAENMAASKRHIPHFSYVEECDVTALEAMREQLNAHRGDKPKLTLLPLLITAICRALPQFPMINARYDDEAGVVTRYGAVHLGMAAQTPAGLMVPVIRNAQGLNLWQLAREIVRLADATRSGNAKSEELSGSTLTVTSLGPLGGIATTPVINRPEVAIIGPNRIVERPMFVPDGMGGERIEKRKLMNISISCDHRVVDGHDAASFVQAVRKLIETPVLLLAD